MPQLELVFWLFNFILSWIFLILVFSLLVNKNEPTNIPKPPQLSSHSAINNNWIWN